MMAEPKKTLKVKVSVKRSAPDETIVINRTDGGPPIIITRKAKSIEKKYLVEVGRNKDNKLNVNITRDSSIISHAAQIKGDSNKGLIPGDPPVNVSKVSIMNKNTLDVTKVKDIIAAFIKRIRSPDGQKKSLNLDFKQGELCKQVKKSPDSIRKKSQEPKRMKSMDLFRKKSIEPNRKRSPDSVRKISQDQKRKKSPDSIIKKLKDKKQKKSKIQIGTNDTASVISVQVEPITPKPKPKTREYQRDDLDDPKKVPIKSKQKKSERKIDKIAPDGGKTKKEAKNRNVDLASTICIGIVVLAILLYYVLTSSRK